MNRDEYPVLRRTWRRGGNTPRRRPQVVGRAADGTPSLGPSTSAPGRRPRAVATHRRFGRGTGALGVILAWVVLTACNGASTDPTSSPPPSTSPTSQATTTTATSTPSATTPQQQALDAYRAMWAAWVTAARTSDAHTKTIGHHATGNALELILTSLAQDKKDGVVTRGQPVLNPRVQSAEPASDPTHVTVADCADASRWLKYSASTGKLKDDVPGGRHAITAVVQKVGDTWMVVQFIVQSVGTC